MNYWISRCVIRENDNALNFRFSIKDRNTGHWAQALLAQKSERPVPRSRLTPFTNMV